MKALVSAIALLSFFAAATVPAVAYAEDAPATTPAKHHTRHHRAHTTRASTHHHHTTHHHRHKTA